MIFCGENRRDMEEWLNALRIATENRRHGDPGTVELLEGNHQWYATSHARPTYCNVCRDNLHGKKLYFYIILLLIIIKLFTYNYVSYIHGIILL